MIVTAEEGGCQDEKATAWTQTTVSGSCHRSLSNAAPAPMPILSFYDFLSTTTPSLTTLHR